MELLIVLGLGYWLWYLVYRSGKQTGSRQGYAAARHRHRHHRRRGFRR